MKKLILRFVLSVLIGVGMLYLASLKIDFGKSWAALAHMQWWLLVPYFAVMALQHFFRAWRWGFLLAPICKVPLKRILPVASVGFFAIIALPLRMGELVRPYLISDPPRIRMSEAFGTMAVERVFDGLILACACLIALALASNVPGWLYVAGFLALGLFCAMLVMLILTLWKREQAASLCRRIGCVISPAFGEKTAHVVQGVAEGFKVLPNLKRLLPFLCGTFAYWILNGVAVWILGISFGMGLSPLEATAVMVIVGIGIMIPAGPAFAGNFEIFAVGALGLYASQELVASRGGAFILTFHVSNALWYVATGFLAMLSPQVSFAKVLVATTSDSESLEHRDAADESSRRAKSKGA